METEVIVKARILRLPRGTLLNKEAIAHLLDVSSRTIQRMCDRQEIPPGIHIGRRKFWLSDRIIDFFSERAEAEERAYPRREY